MKTPILLLAITILVFPYALLAQGTLRGTVVDSVTHDRLVGVNVFIVGTAAGAATDREGEYRVPRVPSGRFTVRASCIGYVGTNVEVGFTGVDTSINFALLPDVLEGQEIVVMGQARGQIAAINQQVSSNTIINVVSEEKIKELPDANAAEAIGRLPGVSITRSGGEANRAILRGMSDRFGLVTVDGIRMAATDSNSRGLDLSTISQGSLAGIELFKALTPDKDGDAIAGSINLVTRKAPSERLFRFESKGAYNKLNKTVKQYDFALRYGERFFDDVLGLQVSGGLEQRDRSNETLDLDYDVNKAIGNDRTYQINTFTLNYVDEIRKRGGFSVLADVNTPDGGSIKASSIYNSTKRDFITYTRNYPVNNPNPIYGARDREQEVKTFNGFVRGDNSFLNMAIGWGLSFAQSRAEDPYDFQMDFFEPSITGANPAGMASIPESLKQGPPEALIPYAYNNYSKAFLYDAYYRYEKNLEKEKTAFLDLTVPYGLGDFVTGSLKFGGKYRHKTRFKERSELLAAYYNMAFPLFTVLPDGTVMRKNLSSSRFENMMLDGDRILVLNFLDPTPANRNIFGKYLLNPMIVRDALRDWYTLNQHGASDSAGHGPEYNRNNAVDADYYDIVERVGSGYVMNTFNIGQQVTVIGGVRVEAEHNDYLSRFSPFDLAGFPTPTGLIKDTTVSYSETIWLPNLQLAVRPLEYLTVRLAAYKALARPDFNQRLENFIARKADRTFYPNNSLTVGNPRLKAAKAWNYELNTSIHSNTVGLFTVSAFYKTIKDMFHIANGVKIEGFPAHNQRILDSLGIQWQAPTFGVPIPALFLTYAYNSPRTTKVWGFEFEHQADLRFLPGFLQNVVLGYNLSIVRSETYVLSYEQFYDTIPPPFPGPPPSLRPRTEMVDVKYKLEGQPDMFGNAFIGYDIGGLSARVSVYYQSSFNKNFSGDGKSDEVVGKFSKWDFSAKQDITDNITLTLNVNNFTNVQEDNTLNDRFKGWELLNTSQLYGLSADLGVRFTF